MGESGTASAPPSAPPSGTSAFASGEKARAPSAFAAVTSAFTAATFAARSAFAAEARASTADSTSAASATTCAAIAGGGAATRERSRCIIAGKCARSCSAFAVCTSRSATQSSLVAVLTRARDAPDAPPRLVPDFLAFDFTLRS